MKRLIPLVFALGCASDAGDLFPEPGGDAGPTAFVEGLEIGTAHQPIFLPDYYGREVGVEGGNNHPSCHFPWADSSCKAPDNKLLQVGFDANSCSTWYQTRFVNAFEAMRSFVAGLNDDEWVLSGPVTATNYVMKCMAGAGGGELGAFAGSTNPSDNDVHVVPGYGQLYQYRKGNMFIRPSNIEAYSDWATRAEAERIRFVENSIKHELGHLLGLGHVAGCGPLLMNSCPDSTWWSGTKAVTSADRTRMKCYNEDSGTTDDC